MMRKYLLILSLLITAAGMAQAPNIIYGKDVIISTRDTSSAELTIKNSTRNVLGYFKNIGGGKGQYTLIPQTDIIALPDSLLARYTKTQSDARYKSISWFPTWTEVTDKPANFSTTYALSNDIQDSLLNKVTRSGSYADPSWITGLAWSKITGAPAFITSYTETDPTIYAWAKTTVKPTYTYAEITGTVPTWNQNTTGTAASLSAVLSSSLGGAGTVNGLLKANGSGGVSAATAGDIPSLSGSYVDLTTAQTIGGAKTLTSALSGTTLSMSGAGSFGTTLGVGVTSPTSVFQVNATAGTTHARFSEALTTVGFIGGANGLVSGHNGKLMVRGEAGLILSGQGNASNLEINSTDGSILIASAVADGLHKVIINGGLKVNEGTFNGLLSANSGATVLSSSSSTAGLTIRGGSSVGTASSASGQILIGFTPAYRGSIAYDDNTGHLFIDNLYDNANSNIYLRTRTNGTPINALTIVGSGAATFINSTTATSFIKSGGTASQFLKADGSVDNNTYLTSLSSLTAGSGLIGTAYNGSAAQTFRVDTGRAAAQIVTGGSLNKVRDSIINLIPLSTPISGTYTPTISSTVNVTTSTMNECRWTQIGDIVTVSGTILILPTNATGTVTFQISLPVATEHSSVYDLSGTGTSNELSSNKLVNITGLYLSNTAFMGYVSQQNSSSDAISFVFTYKVIPL